MNSPYDFWLRRLPVMYAESAFLDRALRKFVWRGSGGEANVDIDQHVAPRTRSAATT
jgi:hypothetical protein